MILLIGLCLIHVLNPPRQYYQYIIHVLNMTVVSIYNSRVSLPKCRNIMHAFLFAVCVKVSTALHWFKAFSWQYRKHLSGICAVSSSTHSRTRVFGSGNLLIDSLSQSDEGLYTCTWTDQITMVTASAAVNISVLGNYGANYHLRAKC